MTEINVATKKNIYNSLMYLKESKIIYMSHNVSSKLHCVPANDLHVYDLLHHLLQKVFCIAE